MLRGSVAIVATVVLGAGVTARGQEPPAAVEAEIVRLDVIVTDAVGDAVSGLAREDFEVREDGKLQKLTDFVFVGGPGAAPAPATPVSPAEAASRAEVAGKPRSITIVVDELHLSRPSVDPAKGVLRRFLSEQAAPDDEIALVVVGSSTATIQPTRDRAVLRQAIERIRARADSIQTGQGAQLTAEQAEQILRGDPSARQLGASLLRDEPGRGASYRRDEPGGGVSVQDWDSARHRNIE